MQTPFGPINVGSLPDWLIAFVVISTVLVMAAPKLAAGMGVLVPSFDKWMERRRIEAGVVTSANLEANEVRLHAQLDADAVTLAHSNQLQDRMLGILEESLHNFWEQLKASENAREADRRTISIQWAAVQQALIDSRIALSNMERTLSLNTMTVSRQAEAFAQLECVKREKRKPTNGD